MTKKSWVKVKDIVEGEIKAVWTTEPEDVKKLRLRIIPSGAGTGGQAFTTMVWAAAETRCLGYMILYNLVRMAECKEFTLDQCIKAAQLFIPCTSEFIEYCALPKMGRLIKDALESLDTLETKEQFRELMASLWTYTNRMQLWLHHIFPWEIASAFPKSEENVS